MSPHGSKGTLIQTYFANDLISCPRDIWFPRRQAKSTWSNAIHILRRNFNILFLQKKEKNTGNAEKVSQSLTNNQYTVFVKKNFSLFV